MPSFDGGYDHTRLDTYAGVITLPIVSGASGWEASIDGTHWIPAYGGYNSTVPVGTPGYDLSSPPVATPMRYWGDSGYVGIPDGTTGPLTAYFRYSFSLDIDEARLLHDPLPRAWIAADDWMKLSVNGHEMATYTLDEHYHAGDPPRFQPDLVDLPFLNTLNRGDGSFYLGDGTGLNIITIEAHDGDKTGTYERIGEMVFFDAQHVQAVPEPSWWPLLLAGLSVLGMTQSRRRLFSSRLPTA